MPKKPAHGDAEVGPVSYEYWRSVIAGAPTPSAVEFARSTAGESEHVERQDDVLLAFEVAELHFLSGSIRQCKFRRFLAHLQMRFGRGRLLGCRGCLLAQD